VEIPLETSDGGVSPTADTSELKIFTSTFQARNPFSGNLYNLTAQTGNTFGGTSDDSNATCPITNIRRKPSMATRYLLPEARRTALGLDPGATYIRWDSAHGLNNDAGCTDATCARANLASNFRFHTDDTRLCCDPNVPGDCSSLLGQGSAEYPLLTNRTCATSTRPFTNDDNIVGDWIFVAGKGSAFFTDPNFVNPGQIPGRCKVNTFQECYKGTADGAYSGNPNSVCAGNINPFSCCTGVGTGTCNTLTNICATLDADPELAGLQPDTCDFTEPGQRVQVACARDSAGNTRRDCCGGALYVLTGMPNRGCTLLPRMQYDGDPGKDCSVSNYGLDHRYDNDCNGTQDFTDLCPFLTEWDQNLDTNGDCPGPACRGNECECGDVVGGPNLPTGGPFRTGDGIVTVSDLVATNIAIFNPLDSTLRSLLNDTNNDVDVTVSDIVGTNIEIFRPDSSVCRQITPRQCGTNIPSPCCGDGVISTGEICDDGDLQVSDGCNASCRVESGFTCTGQPSVCTPN
jgi:cysteine-rich repeat protein